MPLARALIAALVASLLVAGAADAKPRKKTACERLAGKDLAPHKKLKVVKRKGRDGSVEVLACTLRGGKVRVVGEWFAGDEEFGWGDVDVVGSGERHVLLAERSGERGSGSGVVRVDTRRPKTRHGLASQSCDPNGLCSGTSAGAPVMHTSGTLAYVISEVHPDPMAPDGPHQLVRLAPDGSATTLGDGAGVTGLRVAGDEFVWTKDGQEQRAPVAP